MPSASIAPRIFKRVVFAGLSVFFALETWAVVFPVSPTLSFQPSPRNLAALRKVRSLDPTITFKRSWFLLHNSLQLLYSRTRQQNQYIRFQDESRGQGYILHEMQLHDRFRKMNINQPVLVYLPGAGKDLTTATSRKTIKSAFNYGFKVFAAQFSPGFGYDSETPLLNILKQVKQKQPTAKIFFLTCDATGGYLVNFMAANPNAVSAVGIINPVIDSSDRQERNSFRKYAKRVMDEAFASQLGNQWRQHGKRFEVSKAPAGLRIVLLANPESPYYNRERAREMVKESESVLVVQMEKGGLEEWFTGHVCKRWGSSMICQTLRAFAEM